MSENPTLRERFARFKAAIEARRVTLGSERERLRKSEIHASGEESLMGWLSRCLEALPASWRIAADTSIAYGPETSPVFVNNHYSSDDWPAVFLARRFVANFGPTGINGLKAVEPYWPEELIDDADAAKSAFAASRAREAVNRFDRHAWFGPAEAAARHPCGCGSRSWLLTGETKDSDYDCVYWGQISALLCLECRQVDPIGGPSWNPGRSSRPYWFSAASFDDQLQYR